MKGHPILLSVACWLLFILNVPATVFYVDVNSTNPVPPYAGWSTASTGIQSAIDVSSDGDLILVNDGVYMTGGETVNGYALTNRVVINKAVTVQSVNGPLATTIQGYQVPATINGDSAIRCVYLQNNAALIGFTVANGATRNLLSSDKTNEQSGGGVWCETSNALVTNCIIIGNACNWVGAGSYSGTLNNCLLNNNTNSVTSSLFGGGGGAAFGMLFNCLVTSNGVFASSAGGGAFSCTLSNCTLSQNIGNGAANCILNNCIISSNNFGGVSGSTLNSCMIYGNVMLSYSSGGGAAFSTLNYCSVYNNIAFLYGGGAYQCVLNFCTVSNNSANWGGGIYEIANATNSCGLDNLVINNSATNYGGGCFVAPSGSLVLSNWNFNGWAFVSNSAGTAGGGIFFGTYSSELENCTFTGNATGGNGGGLSCNSPNFYGNGFTPTIVSNCNFYGNTATGTGGGACNGVLYNCSVIGNQAGSGGGVYGAIINCVVNGNVAKTNGGGLYYSSIPPSTPTLLAWCEFTNNSALNGGGTYGGVFSNCVFFQNFATNGGAAFAVALNDCLVMSNQAAFGGGCNGGSSAPLNPGTQYSYITCSFIGNSATAAGGGLYASTPLTMTNCLFENNFAQGDGGGEYGQSGSLLRCSLLQNTAGDSGGGAYNSRLSYCIVSGNTAITNGGGTYGSSGANCLFVGNSAAYGGGAYNGGFNNSTIVNNKATSSGGGFYIPSVVTSSIIYDNAAPNGTNYFGGTYNYCCTIPLPPAGNNNVTNDPAFVNFAGGNYRLQTNSPCINVGSGSPGSIDLDGRPRVVGGRIDIGAYEFQGTGMGEFIAWLQAYGLPTNGSADYTDTDGDGMNNWQEWIAGTNPTNATSVLFLLPPQATNTTGLTVTWQSVNTRYYYLLSSTNFSAVPVFTSIQSNIVGQAVTTSFTDATATNGGPYFYRVGVQ